MLTTGGRVYYAVDLPLKPFLTQRLCDILQVQMKACIILARRTIFRTDARFLMVRDIYFTVLSYTAMRSPLA